MRTKARKPYIVPSDCKDGLHAYWYWGGDPRFPVCIFCGAMPGQRVRRAPRPPTAVPLILFGKQTPPIDPFSKAARRMCRQMHAIS